MTTRGPSPARPSPAPGIRWDVRRGTWLVQVEVGTGSRTHRLRSTARFPDGTPIREMRAWQDTERVRLRGELARAVTDEAPPTTGGPVTLSDAAALYLPTLPLGSTRRSDLKAWTDAIGHVPLTDLTAGTLALAWANWTARHAASTLNHRRTALVACLTVAAPSLVPLVVATLPHQASPEAVPRELPYPLIHQLLKAMPASRSAAMLAVMAETGLPQATIRRLRPDDVDLRRGRMTLPVRQKGRRAAGVVLPLTPAAVEAWRTFADRQAWGGVTKTTLCTVWDRACAAARKAGTRVPVCTPYILRHSFAARVLDATGGDVQALQALMQHAELETSMRYVTARVRRSVQSAVDILGRQIPSTDPIP